MATTHPTGGTAGGNRGLPIACPGCGAPALRHDDGSVYCSDADATYTADGVALMAQGREIADAVSNRPAGETVNETLARETGEVLG